MKLRMLFSVLIVLLIAVFPLAAQSDYSADLAARGEYLTVKIAVAGPGDEIYFWWGHIGLLIEDALSGQSRFYDWGLFSFDTENFYYNFAMGRLYYSCGVSRAEPIIAHTIDSNRDLTLYTLDLPPQAKAELLFLAEQSVKPENRNYLYHHFYDNCATRVRDILDTVLGGVIKDKWRDVPGRFTLRQHVRRHTWFSPFWDWALNFWMGQVIDTPITVWEEMFLPSEIARNFAGFTYIDSLGMERKLVSNTEIISRAEKRPIVTDAPPRLWPIEMLFGLSLASLLAWIKYKKYRRPLGIAQAVLGLFFGSMGTLLFFLVLFTTHDYTFQNSNLLFVNPLFLIAIPMGIKYARSFNKPDIAKKLEHRLELLWTIIFCAGMVTIIIRLFPGFYQQNQPTQLYVLPFAFALSVLPKVVKKGIKGSSV